MDAGPGPDAIPWSEAQVKEMARRAMVAVSGSSRVKVNWRILFRGTSPSLWRSSTPFEAHLRFWRWRRQQMQRPRQP